MVIKTEKSIHRIIDANLNRAKEGLRVCEDIFRFIMLDKGLTYQFKEIRHKIFEATNGNPVKRSQLLLARDSRNDIGKLTAAFELKRNEFQDILFANIQRAKESIRVLEEFYKLFDKKIAIKIKTLRYEVYDAEKKVAKKFKALHTYR